MSITSVVNDTVTSVSVLNAQKPLPPTITNYSVGGVDDTALDPAGGQTVQINGTGFLPGATITFDGSAVAVVTYVSPNQLTFTSPAKSAGTYTIYVVNADGGTAIYIPGIIYSVLPTWTTGAGTLGSYYETQSISNTVVASGDAPITYSLFSGSLPTGSTLAANGVITGTAPVDSSSTTYSFTIQATDAQLQDSTRSFSLTINTDVVTWVSPANATTYTSAVDSAIANVTLSATDAAGYAVTYSANALPTGLSLSGANISGTPTVIADSSTLLTATAATTNRTATRTINWSITVANDPYFEYNTLLIPGASTTFVDDASTNNFAVTIFGDTKPNNFNPYTPGYYSNYFNNGSPYLRATTNSAFNFGTGDFTVEFWYYSVSIGADARFISNEPYSGSGIDISYESGSSRISWYISYASYNTATLPTANKWHHIAYSRTGTTLYVYVDGIKVNTYSSFTANITSANSLTIGGNSAGGATLDGGYISNLRLVKGVSVYSTGENFTPPTTPLTAISGTSLLTCQSNRFIDNSTNNFTLTVNGNTTVNSFDPFTPNSSYSSYGSGYFDGTGDYLILPDNTQFDFPGDFTVEAWVYLNTVSGAQGVYTSIDNSADAWVGVSLTFSGTSFLATSYISGDDTITHQNTVAAGRWYHIAIVRSGSSTKSYLNGVQSTSTTPGTYSLTQSGGTIGSAYPGASPLNGYISNLRVVKGTAVYTSTFTPPTEPLTAISGTSLLTLQNNQSVNNSVFLDNSTNNFLVTRAGNTTQGTFSPYGGNYSNYFDGSGDYLTIAHNSNLSWTGNTDGSMEAWVYITSSSATGTILSKSDISGSSYPNYAMAIVTGGYLNGYVGQSGFPGTGLGGVTSATAIPLNTWAHVLFTRKYVGGSEQNQYRIFVNGVLRGFTTNESPSDSRAGNCVVGGISGGGSYFSGYISNLRFFNNSIPVAYQTSSQTVGTTIFTPSTTPLVMITGTQLLTCQSNRLIDNSINNFSLTKSGDVSVQRLSPFNPSSVTPTSYSGYFDGTGDYLTLAGNSAFSVGSGDYTIEAWIYPTTVGNNKFLFGFGQNSGCLNISIGPNTANKLCVFRAGIAFDFESTANIVANVWTHIAVTKLSGTTTIWINGQSSGVFATAYTYADASTTVTSIGTRPALTIEYFVGYMSNVRLVKGTALYTTSFTPSTTPLTTTSQGATASQVSLLTLQSTTFIDNSTNNFTVTASGNSQPTIQNPFGYTSTTTNGYTPSTIGGSGYFDGTGDYLTYPEIVIGASQFTAEAWVYLTLSTNATVISTGRFWFKFDSATSISLVQGGVTNILTASSLPSVLNTWAHIAVTRNSANLIQIWLNGVAVASVTNSVSFDTVTSTGKIAMETGSLIQPFYGYITDARIIKGSAVYTSNFVPPAQPLTAVQNTLLLTNMTSAGIYDASMMNDMESAGDAKLSTAVSKFGGSSMYFDGSGDYLSLPSTSPLQFGSANFTIEFWLYLPTLPGTRTELVYLNGNTSGYAAIALQITTSNKLGLSISETGSSWKYDDTTGVGSALTAATWQFITVVRNGQNIQIYVNGTAQGSPYTTTASTTTLMTTYTLNQIGTYNSAYYYLNGYIDDLRVTKGYARYTSNFTPPTTAFPVY